MRIYTETEKLNIVAELQQAINAEMCFKRWSAVGTSFNSPSLRFLKGLCNDRSLSITTDKLIFIDAVSNDYSRFFECIGETALISGKGEQQTMLKDGSRTTSIKLRNSQSKKDIEGAVQLKDLQEESNMLLWYCTDENNTHSIHLIFFQDIETSHITSEGAARLEVRLPAELCYLITSSVEGTSIPEIPNLVSDLHNWLDNKITEHIKQCEQSDTKVANENFSTPSGFLPMSAVLQQPSMDSAVQESSAQPCASTV